jgi:hypothetical protein
MVNSVMGGDRNPFLFSFLLINLILKKIGRKKLEINDLTY